MRTADLREALSALTTRGRAFLAAGATISLCAFVLGFDALLRVGILAVALPLLAALVISRARYRLSVVRSVTPARVSAGQPSTVSLDLANEGSMPMGLLLLEDQVPYVLGTRARFLLGSVGPRWRQRVSYTVRSELRGRYEIGPLSIRVSDPFGLIELVRSFATTTPVVVIPQVVPLPPIPVSGAWTGAGENRPRAFAVGSAEDVTVREYRRGDDLRRVHWPSSARVGELMVRREEQPWQSRATLLLDTRALAHRGSGPASSLEWAISATASIAVHLAQAGFAVRLVSDRPAADAHAWHDRSMTAVGQAGPILEELAVMTDSTGTSLSDAVDSVADQAGLVVAILGRLQSADLTHLSRVSPYGSRMLGIVLDTCLWGTTPRLARVPAGGEHSAQIVQGTAEDLVAILAGNGWYATRAGPDESPSQVWERLGAVMRHGGGASRSASGRRLPSATAVSGARR